MTTKGKCECACGCLHEGTQQDESYWVCDECAAYALDDDGEVVCSRTGRVEATEHGYRLIPPEMPRSDPDGKWAVWWETVGNDAHLCERYASREAAEQAIAAHDWPAPDDHTHYMCGYGVRVMVRGKWIRYYDDESMP